MTIIARTLDELILDEAVLKAALAMSDSDIDHSDIPEISGDRIRSARLVTREERELRALGLDARGLRAVRDTDGTVVARLNRILKVLDHLSREEAGSSALRDRTEIYQSADGQFHWRRLSPNGRVVGASSHGFASRKACVANAERNASPSRIEAG